MANATVYLVYNRNPYCLSISNSNGQCAGYISYNYKIQDPIPMNLKKDNLVTIMNPLQKESSKSVHTDKLCLNVYKK